MLEMEPKTLHLLQGHDGYKSCLSGLYEKKIPGNSRKKIPGNFGILNKFLAPLKMWQSLSNEVIPCSDHMQLKRTPRYTLPNNSTLHMVTVNISVLGNRHVGYFCGSDVFKLPKYTKSFSICMSIVHTESDRSVPLKETDKSRQDLIVDWRLSLARNPEIRSQKFEWQVRVGRL